MGGLQSSRGESVRVRYGFAGDTQTVAYELFGPTCLTPKETPYETSVGLSGSGPSDGSPLPSSEPTPRSNPYSAGSGFPARSTIRVV